MDATPLGVLKHYWGYDAFRPLQGEIIDSILAGRDTLGLLPTGGGKSLTFQVPALLLPGITLVVTPLISLMKDQVDNLRARNVRAVCLHAGMSRAEMRLAMDRARLGKVKLMYLSPEKLSNEYFREQLRELNLSLLVVDEAHCISQWGYDFRPSYLKIGELRTHFPEAPVLALTASATPDVVSDIMDRLHFRQPNVMSRSFSRDNLSYIVRNDFDKERQLLNILHSTTGSAIVYTRSRKRTREVAALLAADGISADYYHAGLAIEDKNERQNRWKSGELRVIVATNAFGMGIDKPDVRVVVHYDMPLSLEEYYQEAGRAGRDGKPAFAVMLVANTDKGRLTRAITDAFPPKETIRRVYELAGNFVSLAVGDGFNRVFEFNFPVFLTTYQLQPIPTRSAMLLLTQAGYFDFVEDVNLQARVMITASKEELYSVTLDEEGERVFNTMLRSYAGLFADFVYINESVIARRADVTEQRVYDTLLQLSRMHVLQYVPRRQMPYLYYTTSRELPKYVELPRAIYEDRRARMEHRVGVMKKFAFATEGCRVNTMLEYFGEKPDKPCGKCDLCRERMRHAPDASARRSVEESVIYVTSQEPRTLEYIVSEVAGRRDDVIETVRRLLESGRLHIDGDDKIANSRP